MNRKNKVFTLMELLAAVIVLGIIGGIVMPIYTRITNEAKDNLFRDNVKALVWTAHYNEEANEPTFSDDVEWCVCELSDDVVQYFIAKGKSFYVIDKLKPQTIKADSEIIISGYPKYAQTVNQEMCRSYKSKLIEDFIINKSGLFRVYLDCDRAFCLELGKEIKIWKPEGISGMSGGGLWYKSIDNYILIGYNTINGRPNNTVGGSVIYSTQGQK